MSGFLASSKVENFFVKFYSLVCIKSEIKTFSTGPLNIQPVVVMRGLKRQQAAASTNFVGCFLLVLFSFFFLLLLSALNDLTGPSAGPLAQITYSIPSIPDAFDTWSGISEICVL